MWESAGPPEQWLVLDLGGEVRVCGLQLRCPGTLCDPKEVTVLRCSAAGEGGREAAAAPCSQTGGRSPPEPDCPWILARRCVLHAGPEKRSVQSCHRIDLDGVAARFLRLVFGRTWGEGRRVRLLRPLVVFAAPVPGLGATPLRQRASLSTLFSEVVNLSLEDRELRRIARKHGIPLDEAEAVRDHFRRWDSESRGVLSFPAFAHCVRGMVATRAPGLSSGADICDSRIRNLWQDVDCDGSGFVELEEFVVWFHKTFRQQHCALRSRHSDHEATVTERFYASLGTNRLRSTVAGSRGGGALSR